MPARHGLYPISYSSPGTDTLPTNMDVRAVQAGLATAEGLPQPLLAFALCACQMLSSHQLLGI